MKIIIGSDHKGYAKKLELLKYLKKSGYDVEDKGTDDEESVDYPIFAKSVCDSVVANPGNIGILLCGTGIGMSIAANKIKYIRCAKVDNEEDAKYSRLHNNANVISLSAKKSIDELEKLIYIFIKTQFSYEERHMRRIKEFESFK